MEVRSYPSVTEDTGYPGVSGNAPLLHCVIVASWVWCFHLSRASPETRRRLRCCRKTFCLFLKRVDPGRGRGSKNHFRT